MHRLDNWDDLRFFLAVARSGGLSAAARDLHVNQSTVFRRVAQLEERLDARLFDRQARGYALNAVGEEMLGLALRVEEDVLSLSRAVQGADHQLRGTVRVTTVLELLERIAPYLARFRADHPGIEIEVNTDQRVYSLTKREADVAIRPGGPPTEPDVVGRRLVRSTTAFYASPKYLEDRDVPRDIGALEGHDLIGFPRGRSVPGPARDDDIVFRADSMTAQAIAAAAGIGVARLPTFQGDHHPGLVRLFHPPTDGDYHLWLLIHADLRQTARVRAFVDFIAAAVAADAASFAPDDVR